MPQKLSTYHAKRNFRITDEPRGHVETSYDEHRFVVQRHEASTLHYDFRLELDGTLKSWAVPKGPSLDPAEKRLAVQVEDHPVQYADFEGVIPENQYGAGRVSIWDSGHWEPVGDPLKGYEAGKLKFRLHGGKLQGGWTLVRTRLRGSTSKPQWLLIKENDDARSGDSAEQEADTPKRTRRSVLQASTTGNAASVKTKSPSARSQSGKAAASRSSAASARKTDTADLAAASPQALPGAIKAKLPATMSAQLATLVVGTPTEGKWSYEIKFDGYRILARIDGKKVNLYTRDGKDWTARLPKQVEALRALNLQNAWLDGEIVVLDTQGIPSFQALQNAFDEKSTAEILYFAFDLLHLNGYDLRNVPLSARRAVLETVLGASAKATQGPLRYSAPLHESAEKLLETACQLSMEGVIGKLQDSLYTGRRSAEWIKLKCQKRQEFVIAGYTDPQGARKFFGSLLLAVYTDDGKLQYVGRVGTGFEHDTLQATFKLLKSKKRRSSPFDNLPKGPALASAHWVEPELVAEVSFAEWTSDGLLRQAVFQGMRQDKPAQQIRREEAVKLNGTGKKGTAMISLAAGSPATERGSTSKADGKAVAEKSAKPRSRSATKTGKEAAAGEKVQGVLISNPDRIIDPPDGATKLDLAHYYETVAPFLLPYLKSRPVYLLRGPGGLGGGKPFFQRHAARTAIPGITILDPAVDPEHEPLMVIDSVQALVSAVQMGTIELHLCNARADQFDRPDSMVFDLDPDPKLPFEKVIEGAQIVRRFLEELGLKCFVKTSGSKGLHVVVPLVRRHQWEEVTEFCKAVAQHLANTLPEKFSATMGQEHRRCEIFIDYLRNQKMASTVAPYSVRAKKGLPVSVPIDWSELEGPKAVTASSMWNIFNLQKRLKKLKSDPWEDFGKSRQVITKNIRKKLKLGEK
jgi:bifunctional non-homologous end joining protein LigD